MFGASVGSVTGGASGATARSAFRALRPEGVRCGRSWSADHEKRAAINTVARPFARAASSVGARVPAVQLPVEALRGVGAGRHASRVHPNNALELASAVGGGMTERMGRSGCSSQRSAWRASARNSALGR